MARVATAITQYQSNNSGSLPFNTTTYAKYNANSTSHPSINDCGSTSVSNTKKACEFVRDYMNGSGVQLIVLRIQVATIIPSGLPALNRTASLVIAHGRVQLNPLSLRAIVRTVIA